MRLIENKKLSCKFATGLIILILICTFMTSIKNFSDNFVMRDSYNIFLTAHLNFHESSNEHRHTDHESSKENHSHTHKHGENEEEHTHKHVSLFSIPDILFCNYSQLKILTLKVDRKDIFEFDSLIINSFTLETFRPPISV